MTIIHRKKMVLTSSNANAVFQQLPRSVVSRQSSAISHQSPLQPFQPKTLLKRIGTEHTNGTLCQPRQRIDIIPRGRILHHVVLTVVVHVPHNPIQLQRGLDQPRQPQHEEDKTPDDDDPGEEEALRREEENEEDEEDAEAAAYDHVGEEPCQIGISLAWAPGWASV